MRYLHFLNNILISNISRRLSLYKLNLFVTYRCNFKCKTCFIWKKGITKELTPEEYEKIFSKLNVNWVDVSGGEIFLRNDIKDIFSLLLRTQKNLALLHFPTNGFLLEKIRDSVDFILRESKVKLVATVSLDGPEEVHNFIRGINSWRRCIETYKNLKRIKEKRFNVYFGFTINNFNFNTIEKMIEELKNEIPDINYSDIHINISHTSEHYYANHSLNINKEELRGPINDYIEKRKYRLYRPIDYLEHRYHTFLKDFLKNSKSPLSCRSLINSVFIDPEGNIFPCSIYGRKLGNLRDHDYKLYGILKSKESQRLRKEIKDRQCPQCWTPCEAYQMILASLLRL